jgi:hypothetical protein
MNHLPVRDWIFGLILFARDRLIWVKTVNASLPVLSQWTVGTGKHRP